MTGTRAAQLGEFDLIRRYFMKDDAPPTNGVVLGIGDDAALIDVPPGMELVVAVDTILEGRHFLPSTSAHSVGHRALAVNLSDMAAMGATPAWATLALTLPTADEAWLKDFAAGFHALAQVYGVTLVGGDTTRGALAITVQIMGYVPRGAALRRSGARAGDLIAVTGTLGDAGAGLALASAAVVPCDAAASAQLIRRFDYPDPRVKFGSAARGIASAAMDLSDGLTGDLPKLAAACHLAAHVAVEKLPLSRAMKASVDEDQARAWAMSAGDDYELLLCVPPHRREELEAVAAGLNLTLTTIGELSAGTGVTWSLNAKDFVPADSGYDHFAQASTQITV